MNNYLILRSENSPYNDVVKSSVLSFAEMDNNLIFLKGLAIYTAITNSGIVTLKKYNGDEIKFNVGTGGGNDNANTTLERVRITGGGNVGIGNTSPDARLTVTGTANVSGNVVIGGTLAITGNTTLSSNVAVTGSLIVNSAIHYSTNSYTFSNSTARANVDIFDTTVFRTAEYLVQVTDITTTPRSYQVTKLAVVHDNTTPYSTEYSTIFTNSLMGTFDVNITSTSFQLRFTPSTANCVIKLSRTAVVV